MVEAHYAVGDSLFWLGELTAARAHFETSIHAYDHHEHAALALRYGENPKVSALSYLSWTLWSLGYPDQALTTIREALALAGSLAHPPSMAIALFFAARVHMFLGDVAGVDKWTDALVTLAAKESFAFWSALGTVWQGWLLTQRAHDEQGITLMRQGMLAYTTIGATLGDTVCFPLLIEALGRVGRVDEAIGLAEESLAKAGALGERYFESELYRLKGQLLFVLDPRRHPESEALFSSGPRERSSSARAVTGVAGSDRSGSPGGAGAGQTP